MYTNLFRWLYSGSSWQIDGETEETVTDFNVLQLQNHCRWWLQPWNKKMLVPWKKSYDQTRQNIKKQRRYFANKGPSSQSYGFSSGRVWMWGLDHKESWAPNNWCFWAVVLEKTLESPLDGEEIQLVHPKGNEPWIFIGRTDAEAETPILGHMMQRTDSLEKTLMLDNIEGGRKGDDRGWGGWMASPTQWTWVWASSRSWYWTGRPGVL